VALDGYGIYGVYENTNTEAAEAGLLDACGGHVGPVPCTQSNKDDGLCDEDCNEVYHYHFSNTLPFTLGCYGPVNSLEQCQGLYPQNCKDQYVKVPSASDGNEYEVYDLYCPCYQHKGVKNDLTQNIPASEVTDLWAITGPTLPNSDQAVQSSMGPPADQIMGKSVAKDDICPDPTGSQSPGPPNLTSFSSFIQISWLSLLASFWL
jgi:hypothetical protein